MKKNPDLHDWFELDYGTLDLPFLLFKKKKCPKCHCKVRRQENSSFVGQFYRETMDYGWTKMNVVRVFYSYHCDRCNYIVLLSELLQMNKNKKNK